MRDEDWRFAEWLFWLIMWAAMFLMCFLAILAIMDVI